MSGGLGAWRSLISRGIAILVAAVLTACGGSAASPSGSTFEPFQSGDFSPTEAAVASSGAVASLGPTACPTDNGPVKPDCLARVLVAELNLRVQPSMSSESLGQLSLDDPAFVVDGPVEADGYQWYQLASVREPYIAPCGDPAPPPSLACARWFGWAAGVTSDGDRWLAPIVPDCPTERTTDGYLPLLRPERLACAGDSEWVLTVYIAEEGGRGCFPAWVTAPRWLFADCNLFFPQPVERELDQDTRLQTFVHPDLGTCDYKDQPGCPFAGLTGSWVEMTGHLDDPAASTCEARLSDEFPDPSNPPTPPDPDQVVFICRLAFVVTAVRVTSAPNP
jgi:hypothetical protein